MDFTQFINSKDIAEHLKNIDYQFSTAEAAFLVYQSHRATLDEKISAWEYIIDHMPDCSMEERLNMQAIDSFHAFLHKYIDLQKKKIQSFYSADGYIYTLSYTYQVKENDNGWLEYDSEDVDSVCFSSVESCIKYVRQEFNHNEYLVDEKISRIRIDKRPIDIEKGVLDSLEMNKKFEILSIDMLGMDDEDLETDITFDGMWFAFPTPFKRGDILVHTSRGEDIFVLDQLQTWDTEMCMQQNVEWTMKKSADEIVERLKKNGDISDMCGIGYSIMDDGKIWDDHFFDYLSFEKYTKSLQGEYRILKLLSLFLRKEINIKCFTDAYKTILVEEKAKKYKERFQMLYIKEFVDLIGCGLDE